MRWILIVVACLLYAEGPLDTARELLGSSLPEDVQFIPLSGLTNKNYLFATEEKKYVIRLPGEGTEQFVDRVSERANGEEAYLQGFSPTRAISFDPTTGCQLTLFVDGFKEFEFEEFYRDALVKQVAHLLRRIHTSTLKFENRVDFFDRMDRLELYLQKQEIPLPPEYLSLKQTFQKQPHLDCFEDLPSHGDPVPSNFLFLEGQLMLFDWEYSGLNDPAYDLAFFSTVMNYSKEREEDLLRHYGAVPMSLLREKIVYFKPIIESWLGLWGILQTATCNESQIDFFKSFSSARFKRAENILQSKEYAQAIEWLSSFYKKDGRLFRVFPIDPQVPLIAPFPRLSDRGGLTQIEFGLWVCPYCGILNPMAKRGCVCPNCPLK